jgi:tetratricopeptide (TPR) repeat protein
LGGFRGGRRTGKTELKRFCADTTPGIALDGKPLMQSLMRYLVVLVLGLAFSGCAASPAAAQSTEEIEWAHRFDEAYRAGRFADALFYVQKLQVSYEQRLSPNDPYLASLLFSVANVYRLNSRADEAIAIYNRALAIRERAYGPDDIRVGQVLNMIGITYNDHGYYAEAEQAFKRSIAIAEISHKPGEITAGLSTLAEAYARQGRYADAVSLAERAVAERMRVAKADDQDIPIQLEQLGSCYHELGRDAEAEPMLNRALAMEQKLLQKFGASPATETRVASAMQTLATLHRDRRRYEEAEKLYLGALNLLQNRRSPDDPGLTTPLTGLGALYRKQGKYAEAENIYKRVIAIGQKFFAPG